MELALCLGDNTNKQFSFLEKPSKINDNPSASSTSTTYEKDLGFLMGLDVGVGGQRSLSSSSSPSEEDEKKKKKKEIVAPTANESDGFRVSSSLDPSLQLQLHFPWLNENNQQGRGRIVSGPVTMAEEEEEEEPSMSVSPPHSVTSSFKLDFGFKSYGYERRSNNKRDKDDDEKSVSRASNEDNDDENGTTRKKLRLSKDQSAFLEDSFKEHSTLNPKQKIELAKQLNLRPRQVEVWFQNRRARTKLKQTEVDCEYLKRCCDSLTEENRKLQKEVKELRALKTSSSPFYMQLPPTTLTMCPSCERVATSASHPSTSAANNLGLSTPSLRGPLVPVKPRPAKQVS